MGGDPTASYLERWLYPEERWVEAPIKVWNEAKEMEGHGSIGIGLMPNRGWFILITQGQGSGIAWAEWEDDLMLKEE